MTPRADDPDAVTTFDGASGDSPIEQHVADIVRLTHERLDLAAVWLIEHDGLGLTTLKAVSGDRT